MAGLYVHIPFRTAPRPHDDAYTVVAPAPEASPLAAALAWELDRRAGSLLANGELRTLYVGGGRPSLCPPAAVRPFVRALNHTLSSSLDEVTVEVHPADATPPYLSVLRRWGVTRLSIEGLSLVGDTLDRVGAAHTPADLIQAIQQSRQAGFDRFSVDLVFGAAGQSRADWKESLQRAVDLGIPHLTLHEQEGLPPDERADQLAFAILFLRAKGYEPYELTHFARPGHRSRHQEHVYAHGSVFGFGPGAESFQGPDRTGSSAARRWSNVGDLNTYVDRFRHDASPVAHDERLEASALAREYILLRLRTQAGLSLDTLATRYGLPLAARKADTLRRLRSEGLIHDDPDRVRLTDRGRLVADAITHRLVRDL